MSWLLLGALSFGADVLSDVCRMRRRQRTALALFCAGCAMLGAATVLLLRPSALAALAAPRLWDVPAAAALCAALGLLLYTLFGALPAAETYREGGGGLVDTGMYALCRHPGVLWLILFYLLAYLWRGDRLLLAACALFGGLDVLYVLWQDRVFFPRCLPGYEGYRRRVPFLLPTRASLARALKRAGDPPGPEASGR